MLACGMPASPPIHVTPLPYEERLEARSVEQIDLIVIHCTELPNLAMARDYGERIQHEASQTGNSGHYYVDRDGSLYRYVRPERIAHHTRGYNPRSIGIELVNAGRYPDWFDSRHQAMTEPYSDAQIDALIALLGLLSIDLPNLRWVAGHEQLDTAQVPASDNPGKSVARKRDPGPLFPWARVLAGVTLLPLEA
jgi:N-acetylmuramoyl-L-alanine amidase